MTDFATILEAAEARRALCIRRGLSVSSCCFVEVLPRPLGGCAAQAGCAGSACDRHHAAAGIFLAETDDTEGGAAD